MCGAVELLPSEVPPPLDVPERYTELSRKHFLYTVDRVSLPRFRGHRKMD